MCRITSCLVLCSLPADATAKGSNERCTTEKDGGGRRNLRNRATNAIGLPAGSDGGPGVDSGDPLVRSPIRFLLDV